MNKLEDLQDKFFLDIQNIIQELSEIDSVETLIGSEYLVKELAEKTAFLKYSKSLVITNDNTSSGNNFSSTIEDQTYDIDDHNSDLEDNQILTEETQEEFIEPLIETEQDHLSLELSDNEMFKEVEDDLLVNETFGEVIKDEEILIDEVIVNEEQEIIDQSFDDDVAFIKEEVDKKDSFEENKEIEFSFAFSKPQEDTAVEAIENELHDNSDSLNTIESVSIEESITTEEVVTKHDNVFEESRFHEEKHSDKKFKIASIKGMTKSLFDLDSSEKNNDAELKSQEIGSLLKTNVATEYMEAPKQKPEFRLDLNDKIAFTQKLFGNSQVELNQAVTRLNSYDNLDAAKEYLSDLYYERNWEKVDSYAQRLWTLVENRFL